LRKRWEPPLVVPKVKPPALPPLVRRGKDGGDVLLRTRLPQLKDAATGPHRHANSPLPRRQGKRLRGEKMGPQIPVGVNPQKPFANRREDGCLRDGVGAEIMQLHPVEMQNRPHKTTRWHSEPPLVERDETQHIPRRRGWGGSARRGHPLRLWVTREGTKQAIGNKGLQIVHRDGRERTRVARQDDGHPIGHHQAKEVAVERTRCTAFFLWLFPSGCGNLSGRRAARVKNCHRSLFRIYKGLGETRSTLRPNLPRNSKLKGETPVPRTARTRTTAAPRTTRPIALTLRQDRRHLWQAKQATLHLRHDDRVKKGTPRRSISYPFSLPLSLSCYRDRERGYSERDPSPRRKRAPSPPTDQRLEGWPLGRVRQPPQSTRAPRPLLVRGSKAGPSEGFDSRLRPLGFRAHSDQGFVGWPPKGSTAASEHAERGMALGTSDTWPRLELRSRGTLGHFRDPQE
jgi:hypothetical protein